MFCFAEGGPLENYLCSRKGPLEPSRCWQVAPTLSEFLDETDFEFERYRLMKAGGGNLLDQSLPEVQRLAHLYEGHVEWQRRKEEEARQATGTPLARFYPRTTRNDQSDL